MTSLDKATHFFDQAFLWYFTSINIVYLFVMLVGSFKVLKRKRQMYFEDTTNLLRSSSVPEITFLIPAYNEEKTISDCLDNVLALSYPRKRVVVVNDGSKDKTLAILKEKLELVSIPYSNHKPLESKPIRNLFLSKKYKAVTVIDKENGHGKFDALNAGLNVVQTPYFVCLDADTIIDDATFLNLIRPLLSDPTLVGVGAGVKIRNGCDVNYHTISTKGFPKNTLPIMQTLEYLRSFLERQGWDYIGGNFVISGAFAVFATKTVLECGGYFDTVAEDMEIVIRMHKILADKKQPFKILYLPDPIAWTLGPETVKTLTAQRVRWQRGLMDCLCYHSDMLWKKRYGLFSFFVYPFWIWSEAIEPIVELLGVIYVLVGISLGFVHMQFVFLFILVTWGFTTVFTAHCIMLEEFNFRRYPSWKGMLSLIIFNALENIGYRQLNMFWRIRGIGNFFLNYKTVKKNKARVRCLAKHAVSEGKSHATP